MKGYFVVVKAKVWDDYKGDYYNDTKLLKIANLSELGEQLEGEYGDDLGDFSVTWIGGENIGLSINEDMIKELEDLN